MITQLKNRGNSQGIRLSRDLLESAGVNNDDLLEINIVDDNLVISKKYRHRTLEERATPYNGKIGLYKEFDWGEPKGSEIW